MHIHHMKKTLVALCAVLGLGGTGCGTLEVPDLNNPSLDDFREHPTRAGVISASTGLLVGLRTGQANQTGYVAELGVLGREAFIFDGSDPRPITELLGPAMDPGGPAYGGNLWGNPYANIRNANTLLDALEKVPGVTDAEKEATRGFAKTMQALDFLVVINTRDTNGAPVDVNRPLDAPLAPIVSKEEVFEHIAILLDEAKDHLKAGGDAFPFPLSTGFKGFDTPATFLRFNRAVKARVDVYREDFPAALTDLSESFLDVTKGLDVGAYHTFAGGSGELTNGLADPDIYAHPLLIEEQDHKKNGDPDDRVTRKVFKDPDGGGSGADGKLSSDLRFKLYPDGNASLPIIRNEELILLRAEAYIGAQNLDSAIADINFIRAQSGGLEPRTDLTKDNIEDELLKQRRYSLLFEGGHRWIDMRRHNKLQSLPREYGDFPVHEKFPIPKSELDARQ